MGFQPAAYHSKICRTTFACCGSIVIPGDNAVAHIEAIALTASTALKAFEPRVLGGQAKPEVWSNWADFSKRMNEFVQKTRQAEKIAKEQGKDAALAMILDALPCKGCHDHYRDEKKHEHGAHQPESKPSAQNN